MKKTALLIISFAAIASGCAAIASDGKQAAASGHPNMRMMAMPNMDANRDGVITKQEFMAAHEIMFDRMKNKEGVIDARKMGEHCPGMMGGHKMEGHMMGGMMGGETQGRHPMMGSCPMMHGVPEQGRN